MRFITQREEFESVDLVINTIVNKHRRLPESVFFGDYGMFLFFAFDKIFTKDFFRRTEKFLRKFDENIFWVSVIDPDPEKYFFNHFRHYGVIECMVDDTDKDYIYALNADPGGSSADALIHNSNVIAVVSPSADWVIHGDRAADVAVCAFRTTFRQSVFFAIYEPILFSNTMAAANFAFHGESHAQEEDHQKFVRAYAADN